jgi:hypothetical protein
MLRVENVSLLIHQYGTCIHDLFMNLKYIYIRLKIIGYVYNR